MGTLWQDLQYGWRMLQRSPVFTLVAVLTLAIGIGANAVIFSVIYPILLRPLPFRDANRIVLIWDTDPGTGVYRAASSPAEFLDWRDRNNVFESLSAFRALLFSATGGKRPEEVNGRQVSGNFFRLLGVHPILGRDFAHDDEQPGHEQVVLLGYDFWRQYLAGDPDIAGKTVALDGKPYTVIGVLPRGLDVWGVHREYEVWVPFAFNRAQLNREDHELTVFAKLRPGVTIRQAQANMEIIGAQLKREYPGVDPDEGVRVVRFQDDLAGSFKPALLVLQVAVGLVLLIACANVANLMLARATAREQEIAVRAAMGAGRRRILRQLLTESALLAGIGGIFGIVVAYGGLNVLRALLPAAGVYGAIPHSEWIKLDGTVVAFTLCVSLLAGIVFGCAPAFQLSRPALAETLKEGGRGLVRGRRGHVARAGLVVSEVALSLMLLIGAGLLLRSFSLLMSRDMGFNPSRMLTMQIWLPESRYPAGAPVANFYQELIDRVEALPGVKSASAVNYLPLSGWAGVGWTSFDIQGRAKPLPGDEYSSPFFVVDWRYLRTMQIQAEEGRDFASSDGPHTAGAAIINETLARRYWSNEDPVGQKIRLDFQGVSLPWLPTPSSSWLTIVGVAHDIHDWAHGEEDFAQLYLLQSQNPSRIMRLVVRANGDPGALASPVRQAVQTLDSNLPVTEVHTMDELLAATLARRRLATLLLAVFAAAATLLAAAGIYGVMGYAVAQRDHEIGIRMALGARPADVLRMVLRDGMRLAAIGMALGIAGSFAAMRFLQSQLYSVKATDLLTLACAVAALAAVAAAACYFPARRAMRVDPLVALRHE